MMTVSYCLSFLTFSVLCGQSACLFISLPNGVTSQGMLFLKRWYLKTHRHATVSLVKPLTGPVVKRLCPPAQGLVGY